jgi:carbonic anhydrase/acetyltransferase-like protein (isoleucine patch superfamily)
MGKRIDVDTLTTKHTGLKGLFEVLFRRFKVATHIATMIPVYLFGCLVIGLCLTPSISLFRFINSAVANESVLIQNFAIGFALALGFFTYGTTLLFVAPAINFLLRCNLKPWRGPYYSAEAFKWFMHNALTYLPRFTFLDFVTPSPLAVLFYQMMGMKVGKGTVINTTYISDPSLISMGEKVTIGGSVTIVGHYGQAGLLIFAPVIIGNNCTIGLKSSVMGGVTIGNNVKIMPHSVVIPKTTIPDNEVWGGVPARKIDPKDDSAHVQKTS